MAWMCDRDVRLAPLIVWSKHEDLVRTMPQYFHYSFGTKVCVIIDSFEEFIDCFSTLYARAQTYWLYKSHSTVKILIGITPRGRISFVSQAWDPRTSDKYLTELCKFLNKLVPEDMVMADHGFTMYDSVVMQRAEIGEKYGEYWVACLAVL